MSVAIRNALVVTKRGEERLDIKIAQGVIAEMGTSVGPADSELDGTNCHVLP